MRKPLWSLAFACLVSMGCGKPNIIGKWQRQANPNVPGDSLFINTGSGDLIISADSTFSISGDTTAVERDTVKGWNTGAPESGRWQIEDGYLCLHTAAFPKMFELKYRILKLTNKHLEILSAFDADDSTKRIKYVRVK